MKALDYLKKSKYWIEFETPTRGLYHVAPNKVAEMMEQYANEKTKKLQKETKEVLKLSVEMLKKANYNTSKLEGIINKQ